jgi:Arc/MetJ-type ribon-helix-helix transcriptional regulator
VDIELPPSLGEFVRAQVRAGRYVDEQDVVRDAVRRLRAEFRALEEPNATGLVRDAIRLATQTQRDVISLLQTAERETDVVREVIGAATNAANTALDAARRVPGAREVDRMLRGSVDQVSQAAERGESQARAMRQGLEGTAKALGMLTLVLERVNAAGRTVNQAISPGS